MDSNNNTGNKEVHVGGIRFDDLLYAEKPNFKNDLYLDLIHLVVTSNYEKDNAFEIPSDKYKASDHWNREEHAKAKYRNDLYFAAFCKMQVAQIFEIINKNLGI